MEKTKKENKPSILRRIWREHTRKYIWHIAAAMGLTSLAAMAEAYSVALLRPIFDQGLVEQDKALLFWLCAQITTVYAGKGLLSYFQMNLMAHISNKTIMSIRHKVFSHVIKLDMGYFSNTSSGDLLSRIVNQTNQVAQIALNFIQTAFKDITTVVSMFGLMIWSNWQLFMIIFLFVPFGVVVAQRLSKKARNIASADVAMNAGFMVQISESLQNVKVIKSYGMEAYESRAIGRTFEEMNDMAMKRTRIVSSVSPIMESLSGFVLSGIILFGGWQIASGTMTTGSFVTFLGAWVAVYKPLKALTAFRINFQMAMMGAASVYEILDTKPKIVDAPDAKRMEGLNKGIKLNHVNFEYDAGKPILRDVTISVPKGKTIALVGQSGGGKSTIINLIPRFFDVSGGSITIDGIDIRELTMKSLRENIAIVSQDIMLFDSTIRNNIAYGKGDKEAKEITDAEIVRAAKLANADNFINAMSEGYQTKIGERGVKLSGGQKQRISIARALIKDAPILLLDEATSALDTESERLVQQALDNLMKDRTTIVIAHRLSTIINADKIYVIERGEVVEEGTHAELLKKKGEYAKLYNMQFQEASHA